MKVHCILSGDCPHDCDAKKPHRVRKYKKTDYTVSHGRSRPRRITRSCTEEERGGEGMKERPNGNGERMLLPGERRGWPLRSVLYWALVVLAFAAIVALVTVYQARMMQEIEALRDLSACEIRDIREDLALLSMREAQVRKLSARNSFRNGEQELILISHGDAIIQIMKDLKTGLARDMLVLEHERNVNRIGRWTGSRRCSLGGRG
jgi:hypothetical protein